MARGRMQVASELVVHEMEPERRVAGRETEASRSSAIYQRQKEANPRVPMHTRH
jgi:hypothetical protein